MRVKRYVVDSMPDALQKIRSDLGKDAVILNTKEIRSGGFLGLFGKRKIEVIAATDSSASVSVPPRPFLARGAEASENRVYAARLAASQQSAGLALLEDENVIPPVVSAEQETSQPSRETKRFAQPAPMPPDGEEHEAAAHEAALNIPQMHATAAASRSPTYAPSAAGGSGERSPSGRVNEDLLLNEIKQMKEMVYRLSRAGQEQEQDTSPVLRKLESRLLEQEVEPLIAKRLLREIAEEREPEGDLTEEYAVRALRRKLIDILRSDRQKAILPDTKVAHFVGPTGVGKTTTIAKLAAEQVLKHKRKVGFITSDTYRIAAVEQLRTYATILNVPLEVVFSPHDLLKAFQKLDDRDIIFMDTAGRNYRNEMYVSELNALLSPNGNSETFLVLSLTMKYRDMKAITENFMKFSIDKVLFTKLDETDSYGSIVNLVHDLRLHLSYVANGQSVPDDIAEADEERIVDLILGDAADE